LAEHERRQHDGGQRHRGRLRDERPQQRNDGQAKPDGSGGVRHRNQARKQRNQSLHCRHHGGRGGHYHDDKDKRGFAVFAAFRIIQRFRRADQNCHGKHQDEGPKAEDNFNLAKEMQQAGVARVTFAKPFKRFCGKCVRQGQAEDNGRDNFK
jgi:hypothetical protein